MASDETCLSPDVVLKLLAGDLPPDEHRRACDHLDQCQDCQDWVGAADSPESVPKVDLPARYELREELGRGGMGVVVRAWDRTLERDLAVKVLHPDLAQGSAEHDRRLLRESKAMARLRHPNVVTVYDAVEDGARVFVAMEYVKGRDLRGWLQERSRPWRDVLRLFVLAGQGLASAHRAGLVHRDFKPANVLIGPEEVPQVTDFGLARALGPATDAPLAAVESRSTTTRTGRIAGTPAYMAPEQMTGKACDARTDIFAFCVSLWEALHGERPFDRPDIEARALAIEAGTIPPPKNQQIPKRINAALAEGMAHAPEDRPQTMERLLGRLEVRAEGPRRAVLAAALAVATMAGVAGTYVATSPTETAVAVERELPLDPLSAFDRSTVLSEVGEAIAKHRSGEGLLVWSRRSTMVTQHWDALDKAWKDSFSIEDPAHRLAVQTCVKTRRATLAELLAQGREGNIGTLRGLPNLTGLSACDTLNPEVAHELWSAWTESSPVLIDSFAKAMVARPNAQNNKQKLVAKLLDHVRRDKLPPSAEAFAMEWEAELEPSAQQRREKMEAVIDLADRSGLIVTAAMAATRMGPPTEDTRHRVARLPPGPTRERLEAWVAVEAAAADMGRDDHVNAREKIEAVMPTIRTQANPALTGRALNVLLLDTGRPAEDRIGTANELLAAEQDLGGERSRGVLNARQVLFSIEYGREDFDAAAHALAPALEACGREPPCLDVRYLETLVFAAMVATDRGQLERAQAALDQADSLDLEQSELHEYLIAETRCQLAKVRRDRDGRWPCPEPLPYFPLTPVPPEAMDATRAFMAMLEGDVASAQQLAERSEPGIKAGDASQSANIAIWLAEVWLETGKPARALRLCEAVDPDDLAQIPTLQATAAIIAAQAKHALGQDAGPATREALRYAEAMRKYPARWTFYLERLAELADELGG